MSSRREFRIRFGFHTRKNKTKAQRLTTPAVMSTSHGP